MLARIFSRRARPIASALGLFFEQDGAAPRRMATVATAARPEPEVLRRVEFPKAAAEQFQSELDKACRDIERGIIPAASPDVQISDKSATWAAKVMRKSVRDAGDSKFNDAVRSLNSGLCLALLISGIPVKPVELSLWGNSDPTARELPDRDKYFAFMAGLMGVTGSRFQYSEKYQRVRVLTPNEDASESDFDTVGELGWHTDGAGDGDESNRTNLLCGQNTEGAITGLLSAMDIFRYLRNVVPSHLINVLFERKFVFRYTVTAEYGVSYQDESDPFAIFSIGQDPNNLNIRYCELDGEIVGLTPEAQEVIEAVRSAMPNLEAQGKAEYVTLGSGDFLTFTNHVPPESEGVNVLHNRSEMPEHYNENSRFRRMVLRADGTIDSSLCL